MRQWLASGLVHTRDLEESATPKLAGKGADSHEKSNEGHFRVNFIILSLQYIQSL